MRNLKRVLSLALASVMLLGMMVVGTSAADFVDADDIKNEQAAAVTAGLGIFDGKTVEGSDATAFDPTAVVRRSEMAAIICKILYGADLDANIYKGAGKFSDVADFEGGWAEGYINLCSSLGIVDGYAGTTKFGPGDPVKASEAAVMLTKALGYFKNSAEYGSSWDIAAMDKARNLNILDGIVVTKDEGLTRDNVAAMVYNAITKAAVVEYNTAFQTYYNVGSNWAAGVDNSRFADTLGSRVFNMTAAKPIYAVVLDNKATGRDTTDTTVVVCQLGADGTIDSILNTKMIANFVSTDLDEVGSVIEIYSKNGTLTGTTSAYFGDIYGTRVVSRKAYVSKNQTASPTNATKLKTALGVSTLAKAGEQVNFDANYNETGHASGSVTSAITNGAALKGTYVLYADEVVSYIPDLTVTMAKVSNITTGSSAKITLTQANTDTVALDNKASNDDVKEYDGIKKNDIVSYVRHGDIYVLTKAATVEGKITRITSDNKLTLNGTEYSLSTLTNYSKIENDTPDFEGTFTLYLTPENKYFAIVEKDPDANPKSDIVYVMGKYSVTEANDYGVTTTYTYAQVVGLDGAESSVLVGVKPQNGDQMGTASPSTGFYTFALSDNSEAEAKEGIMEAAAAPATYNKTTAPIFKVTSKADDQTLTEETLSVIYSTDSKAYLTANTKFFFVDGTEGTKLDIEVIAGSVDATLAASTDMLLAKDADGNYVVYAVFFSGAYEAGPEVGENYIYVADAQSTPAQVGTNKYEYTVYDAVTGEKKTITATNATIAAAGFYTYTIADGVYTVAGSKVTEGDAVKYAEDYASKFGTKISTSDLTDTEAGSALIVDTRTDDEIEDSEIAAISTLAAIHAAKNDEEMDVTFDCLVGTDGVTIIFITNVAAS